jgi:GDP-L-fucose synthase
MEKEAKIYVAGYKGLVGSAIRRKLQEKGYTNLLLSDIDDFDLQRQAEVEAFFERERPEYTFLAAAREGAFGPIKPIPQNLFTAIFPLKSM